MSQTSENSVAESEAEYLSEPKNEKRIREKHKDLEKVAKDPDFTQVTKFHDEIKILKQKI